MLEPDLLTWPAPERNKAPILEVLQGLGLAGVVLELASGTGQHAVHFAGGLSEVTWQPSDADPELLEVIQARVSQAALANLRSPMLLDVSAAPWPATQADAIFCANLVHISPWSVTRGMFHGAQRLLKAGGCLITYGPYRFHGSHTSVSNADFDASLRARDPDFGVRDVDELLACATPAGLALERSVSMPANNFTLVWRRQ